jgi:hypothetical protein
MLLVPLVSSASMHHLLVALAIATARVVTVAPVMPNIRSKNAGYGARVRIIRIRRLRRTDTDARNTAGPRSKAVLGRVVLAGGYVVAKIQFRRRGQGGAIRRGLLDSLLILMVADIRREPGHCREKQRRYGDDRQRLSSFMRVISHNLSLAMARRELNTASACSRKS